MTKSTPTGVKPGIATTEWWSSIGVSLLSFLVAIKVIPVGLQERYGVYVQIAAAIAAAISAAAYYISRGIAKHGVPGEFSALMSLALSHLSDPATKEHAEALLASLDGQLDASSGSLLSRFEHVVRTDVGKLTSGSQATVSTSVGPQMTGSAATAPAASGVVITGDGVAADASTDAAGYFPAALTSTS